MAGQSARLANSATPRGWQAWQFNERQTMNRLEQAARHLACIALDITRGQWARLAFHWQGIRRAVAGV
jgi:alkylhydroperoxidase/carboxymuconolactone decarboxylase family protein YurZ